VRLRWTAPGRNYRRSLLWAVPAVGAVALGVATGVGVAAAIHMPRVDSLAGETPALITQLYDRSGRAFASYARERRIVLRQDEIPDLLRDAVIAVEDKNFYRHGGIDAMGVVRAAISNYRQGRREQGASTLTMQLARQLFLTPEK
jgi:penicillin-binding protein 1A